MNNPRYFKVANDDLAWVYDTDIDDLEPYRNRNAWFDAHIASGTCSRPNNATLQIIEAQFESGDNRAQFVGICGTPLIIRSGFNGSPVAEFAEFRAQQSGSRIVDPELWLSFVEKKQAERGPGFIRPAEELEAAADTFFADLDERLMTTRGRSGGLDYCFLEDEKQMYIHLDLGGDMDFRKEFMEGVKMKEKFANWMTTTSIEKNFLSIPSRDAPMESAARVLTHVENVEFINDRERPYLAVDLDTTCPLVCIYRACSLAAGTTMTDTSDTSQSIVKVGIEVVAVKSYCDEPGGGPCTH